MRFLSLTFAVFSSVTLFATAGMPKEVRFVLNPSEPETIITLDELNLASFKVTKCLDLVDAKTGKKTTSMTTELAYTGSVDKVMIGKQEYQIVGNAGQFVFDTTGCVLEMKNIRSMAISLQNMRVPEHRLSLDLSFKPKPYDNLARIGGRGVVYAGKILSYY